ncbi:Import receptor subunit TOM40 [Ceratobasidium theobromae]|uniref:Import receptor subunit TOM40 n=1 Tax=Ceratobasidium theobromae TaxID=1582974 RepID=A0A5N5QNF7_9AGAM|nr:Import receptor subunit TOM40 [Ceratobasidium theobromae]
MVSPPLPAHHTERASLMSSSVPSVVETTSGPLAALASAASPLINAYGRFTSWKAGLGLPNPGTTEDLTKGAKMIHTTNHLFDGARADLSKALSYNPAFQVTHSFNLASYTQPATYNFGAVFANNDIFMQGNTDHDGNVTGRCNRTWSPSNITRAQMQIANHPNGHSMLQLEHDYLGKDFSLSLKAMNPFIDGTGVYITSYLQSVTPRLALGFDRLHQRAGPGMTETTTSYVLRWTSPPSSTPAVPTPGSTTPANEVGKWVATTHLHPSGIIQATYCHRLSEKVEVGAELNFILAPDRREATTTVGAKWDLRMSTMRAQLESNGRLSALLEQRFAPTFAFLIGGEIDHVKGQSKVGVGIMLESSAIPEEMMAQQQPPTIPM